MPYRWSDAYGARMGVMRRADPAAPLRWFEIEPCYLFHTASAHNSGDRIVIVGARYPSLWRDTNEFDAASVLWEWTLELSPGTSSERQLDDTDCEFPRIDDRRTGAAAQVAYCAATDALIRYDLQTGDSIRHEFDGGRPGEAIFVPSAAQAGETEGFLLAYVFRPEGATSDLVILDANDVAGPPLAAVHLPQRVPNGFHGNWFPTTTGA